MLVNVHPHSSPHSSISGEPATATNLDSLNCLNLRLHVFIIKKVNKPENAVCLTSDAYLGIIRAVQTQTSV